MKFIKLLVALSMSIGMTMCHPVMALPVPVKSVKVTTTACQFADAKMVDVIRLMKDGRTNIEVMTYLDRGTPDPDTQPMAYIGVVMVKLNVASVRVALGKAYKEKAIRQTQQDNCLAYTGTTFTIY